MTRSHLRRYFEGAFTGRYYEKADGAYDTLINVLADPKTKLTKDWIPIGTEEAPKKLNGLALKNATFTAAFPQLTLLLVDAQELNRLRKNNLAILVDFHSRFLWIFKNTTEYVLVLGVPTGGAPLTPELMRTRLKTSKVLRHLFVHEFVHYLQGGQFANVLLPLMAYHNGLNYLDQWTEVEAWNVESFSKYLHTVSKRERTQVVEDFESFHESFVRFLLKDHRETKLSGAMFYVQMTQQQKDKFLRESFDLLRKKMAVTTKGP